MIPGIETAGSKAYTLLAAFDRALEYRDKCIKESEIKVEGYWQRVRS